MTTKIPTTAFILLGIVAVFGISHICWQLKTAPEPEVQTLGFTDPPSNTKEWNDKFVLWPRLPVRVRVEGYAWSLVASDAYRSVQAWNAAIGCQVFAMSFHEDAEVVVSFLPQPEDANLAGTARFVARTNKKWGKYWGVDIHIHTLFLSSQVSRDNVMGHELGHALSLADLLGPEEALMYGSISEGAAVGKEVLITLNRLYCKD
tara:strand:+ start:569 stop:1180 length:612 start_codon:yes stop_codon:yes gene_type:complete